MFFNKEKYRIFRHALPPTVPRLPTLDTSTIPIHVVNLMHPNKFWVHVADQESYTNKMTIKNFLNDPKNITLRRVEEQPKIGSLVAARWKDNLMYRVIVESYYEVKKKNVANVFYIDFGYRGSANLCDLRTILPTNKIYTMPALAFECTLTGVEPSKKRDAKGFWTQEACETFNEHVQEPYQAFGTVFSVVDSVVSMRVTCAHRNNPDVSTCLNELLVKQGLADEVEEHYLSKYNNNLREKHLEYDAEHREYLEFLQHDKNFLIAAYPPEPAIDDCRGTMVLRGPFSPLEVTLSSLAILASTKKVIIENNSVNSILLDTDPEDPHERLLVSSIVSQNQSGSQLMLRNTTLMPNIPGLTALICLIFAPKIELRRNTGGTRYVGALCGLGYDTKTEASMLPEHDMEVHFDTEVRIEDMQSVIIYHFLCIL